jgi:hypothetical protein
MCCQTVCTDELFDQGTDCISTRAVCCDALGRNWHFSDLGDVRLKSASWAKADID